MSLPRTSLADAQNALSHLHFAVTEEFDNMPLGVKLCYVGYPGLGLYVEIEVRMRYSQMVADRLSHGILHSEYYYLFESICREISDSPDAYVKVTAYPKYSHKEPLAP